MPRVIYAPDADDDLIGIVEYISHDKPNAARDWLRTIRETCETIAGQPEIGEVRPGFGIPGCRSLNVGNYVIFFRPIADGIEVSRVIHGSRDMRNL